MKYEWIEPLRGSGEWVPVVLSPDSIGGDEHSIPSGLKEGLGPIPPISFGVDEYSIASGHIIKVRY